MIVRRTVFSICVAALVVVCQCKDKEPTPSYYRDLADDSSGAILVPVSGQWHNVDIAKGQADWVPFRKPSELKDEADEETAGRDEDASKEEVLELISEYDELLAEGDVEELLKYHIDSQQESYRPLAELGVSLLKKLDRIEAALTKQLPEEKSRVDKVMSAIRRGSSLMAVADTLKSVSDTEMTGRLPAGGLVSVVNFKYVDEEWFIELPEVPDISMVKPMIDMQLNMFDMIAQSLESGLMPAETVLQQIEAKVKTMLGASDAHGDAPIEKDHHSNDEHEDEDEDKDADDD